MKLTFLALAIPSIIALVFLIRHMVLTRGKKVALYFVLFALVFGFLRAKIIYIIQISLNHSFIPYKFNGGLFKIGDDSLMVYLGWVTVAYIAWSISELILIKVSNEINQKNLDKKILPIIGMSFIVIATFAYAIETAASVMGWWDWNKFLVESFESSLFINVPWVGIIDWGTVAFELLGIFFFVRLTLINKKWIYLLAIILPIIHWGSHLNLPLFDINAFGMIITPSLLVHWLIVILPICFMFTASPKIDAKLIHRNTKHANKWLWASYILIIGVCLLSNILNNKLENLISLIPVTLVIYYANSKTNIINITKFLTIVLILLAFTNLDILIKQKIIIALFPAIYLAIIFIVAKLKNKTHKKIHKIISYTLVGTAILFYCLNFSNNIMATANLVTNSGLKQNQKKVILVTIDTLRSDHVGVYGHDKNTTPNIDKLAINNTYFQNSYTHVPYTVPSHLSLMSGEFPNNKFTNSSANTDNISNNPLLATLFKNHNYKTAAFISTEKMNTNQFNNGFDTFDFQSNPEQIFAIRDGERSAALTNKEALPWLDNNSKEPFFLWIHYFNIHAPYQDDCHNFPYSKDIKPSSQKYINGIIDNSDSQNVILNQQDKNYLLARYDDEIKCVDNSVGELINKLKQLNIYDDATIIIAGDHGENFDHNSLFHGNNVYEGATKIPLIIKSPFLKKGKNKYPVVLTDIYPTLKSWFNLSQKPMSNNQILDKLNIYRDHYSITTSITKEDYSAVTSNGFKLIVTSKDGEPIKTELYNINTDPMEENNLIDSNIQIKTELFKKLNFIKTN